MERGTKGKSFTRRVTAPAKGFGEGLRRKVSIGFPPELFTRIGALADKNSVSFGEQVNRMCRAAPSTKEPTKAGEEER